MKFCKNCKVKVDAERNYCPLCFRELAPVDESSSQEYPFAERKKNETFIKNDSFVLRLFIFLSLCAISICLLVNFLTRPNFLWSLVVVGGTVYVWILVCHTIMSRRGVFEKLLIQFLAITFLLWTCEHISYEKHWLFDYVFPSVAICSVLTMLLITFIRKDKSWILAFVSMTIFIVVVSILSFIYFVTKELPGATILNIVNLAFSGLTTIGYFTFGYGTLRQESSKKFHIG